MSSGGTSPNSLSLSENPLDQYPNIPKLGPGTVIPNRVFVGGFAANTSDDELKDYFSHFGAVRDTKIIHDRAGVSKGYGFVTFETQEDAEKIIGKESQNLIMKERKLNIGPAIKKQQLFPRLFEGAGPGGAVMLTNGAVPYVYQNGMAIFNSAGDAPGFSPLQQAQAQAAAYPTMMMPTPPMAFVSQPSYQYPGAAATPQWPGAWPAGWAPQNPLAAAGGAPGYMYPMPTAAAGDLMYTAAAAAAGAGHIGGGQVPPHAYMDMGEGSAAAAAMAESAHHAENRLCSCCYASSTMQPPQRAKCSKLSYPKYELIPHQQLPISLPSRQSLPPPPQPYVMPLVQPPQQQQSQQLQQGGIPGASINNFLSPPVSSVGTACCCAAHATRQHTVGGHHQQRQRFPAVRMSPPEFFSPQAIGGQYAGAMGGRDSCSIPRANVVLPTPPVTPHTM